MAQSRNSSMNTIGRWAFLIGVVLAVVLGALGIVSSAWTALLVLLGLVVGLLNVTDRETSPFLMSGLALLIASWLGRGAVQEIAVLGDVLDALLAVFAPATIIVAVKNVFGIARN